MVILPTQRRSSEVPPSVPAQAADTPTLNVDHSELTQYLPSLGDLPAAGLLAQPLDVNQERAAALRAAAQGQRSDDEHLALLDRVLEALRRI
ncbi:hypothetical protein DI005_18150 [Prauserella sp. PE36]|uniref:Uncharacterized protein n=1 Tax=Amycolatopsis marina TaxID=490629 RepID=A0A1I1CR48_9PSEU|nr:MULTISPECIES: hypothetical protein [Pseudonocardiaceae]RBM18621.1 hypothetical protein DI005_18150 [Prauserella sp. PE36]SFB64997.1 hypothetical protein SAMN05216266_1531 [Amycolatopsis marina]